MTKSSHIPVLDVLRGVAAVAVCLFHFTNGNPSFLPEADPVRRAGSFGFLGVEAFFVISGFIIPYSLSLRGYRLRDAPGFLIRRLKRLDPPYFACILLVLALHRISAMVPGFRGPPLDLGWPQLLAHVGYLNAILNYDWLSPVFWTLALEFQFYLFVAIVFPLLVHPRGVVRAGTLLLVAVAGFAGSGNSALLPHWLPLFAIGVLTFEAYTGRLNRPVSLLLLAVASIATWVVIGPLHWGAGLATAVAIAVSGPREMPRSLAPLAGAGALSYSLYLLHVPFGMRVINLATRLPSVPVYRYAAVLLALAVSLGAAYLFWRWIERPSQLWAQGKPAWPRKSEAHSGKR